MKGRTKPISDYLLQLNFQIKMSCNFYSIFSLSSFDSLLLVTFVGVIFHQKPIIFSYFFKFLIFNNFKLFFVVSEDLLTKKNFKRNFNLFNDSKHIVLIWWRIEELLVFLFWFPNHTFSHHFDDFEIVFIRMVVALAKTLKTLSFFSIFFFRNWIHLHGRILWSSVNLEIE